jgi:hypothetical protein
LTTLERLALDTLAHVRHLRRALVGKRILVGLLPFDSTEQARMLLPALRDAGARTLLVQHGFSARLGDPDMLLADHLALWSEGDRSLAPNRDPATITVTGNPGVIHLADAAPQGSKSCGRSIVLVDYPGRLSARVGARVSMTHLAVALEALGAARPGTTAVVRPHPGDPDPSSYLALVARHPELRVEIDARTPIDSLLAGADLCIGALSTATLQACGLGVPTVFLDVSGIVRPWPFHGGSLPMATDAPELVEAIASVLYSSAAAGRDEALEALGVRRDAIECVIDLIVDLSQ